MRVREALALWLLLGKTEPLWWDARPGKLCTVDPYSLHAIDKSGEHCAYCGVTIDDSDELSKVFHANFIQEWDTHEPS